MGVHMGWLAKTRSSTLLFTSKQLLVMDVHPHFSWLNQHFSMVFPPFPTINSTKIHHVSQKKLSGSHEIHHFSRWSMVQSLCSILFLWFFYHFSTPQPTGRDARARPARAPRCRSSSPARTPRWTATGRARFRWPNRPGNGNMVGTWWDHNLVGLQHG